MAPRCVQGKTGSYQGNSKSETWLPISPGGVQPLAPAAPFGNTDSARLPWLLPGSLAFVTPPPGARSAMLLQSPGTRAKPKLGKCSFAMDRGQKQCRLT
jgi:hypothetical protein